MPRPHKSMLMNKARKLFHSSDEFTLIFFHIPKTAGTSFVKVLDEVYGGRFVYKLSSQKHEQDVESFIRKNKSDRFTYKAITGHRSDKLASYVRHPVRYVTFLRDPVEHTISSYHYIKQTPHNRLNKIVSKIKTINEFVNWQKQNGHDNLQTRYLAKIDARSNDWKSIEFDLSGSDGEHYFDEAKDFLNSMEFVFVVSEMDEAIKSLSKNLKWTEIPTLSYENQSKKPSDLKVDKRLAARIRRVHYLDERLYEAANQRLYDNDEE